jgi:hypothetical protein
LSAVSQRDALFWSLVLVLRDAIYVAAGLMCRFLILKGVIADLTGPLVLDVFDAVVLSPPVHHDHQFFEFSRITIAVEMVGRIELVWDAAATMWVEGILGAAKVGVAGPLVVIHFRDVAPGAPPSTSGDLPIGLFVQVLIAV